VATHQETGTWRPAALLGRHDGTGARTPGCDSASRSCCRSWFIGTTIVGRGSLCSLTVRLFCDFGHKVEGMARMRPKSLTRSAASRIVLHKRRPLGFRRRPMSVHAPGIWPKRVRSSGDESRVRAHRAFLTRPGSLLLDISHHMDTPFHVLSKRQHVRSGTSRPGISPTGLLPKLATTT
jgi:hypothetical protein